MVELHRRNPTQLQTRGIAMPGAPDTSGLQALGRIEQELGRVAEENFVLGSKALLDSAARNAFNAAPDNPQQFLKMYDSAVKNAISNSKLPTAMADRMQQYADTNRLPLFNKVQANFGRVQDALHEQNVLASIDWNSEQIVNGAMQVMEGLAGNDAQMVKQGSHIIKTFSDANARNAEARNSKGKPILTDASIRQLHNRAQEAKIAAYRQTVDSMGDKDLNDFATRLLSDKNQFMNTLSLDEKSFQSLHSYTTQRLRQLGGNQKLVLQNQDLTVAAGQFAGINEEQLKELEGRNAEFAAFARRIRRNTKNTKFNEALASQDTDYISAVMAMQELMDSQNDGQPDYDMRLLDKAVNVQRKQRIIGQRAGLTENDVNIHNNALTLSLVNAQYNKTVNPFFDHNTALGELFSEVAAENVPEEILQEARTQREFIAGQQRERERPTPPLARIAGTIPAVGFLQAGQRYVATSEPTATRISSTVKREAIAEGANTHRIASALMAAGHFDEATAAIELGNRSVIRRKFSEIVPPQEFDRLERELNAGKPAFIPIRGIIYEFKGYGSREPFLIQR